MICYASERVKRIRKERQEVRINTVDNTGRLSSNGYPGNTLMEGSICFDDTLGVPSHKKGKSLHRLNGARKHPKTLTLSRVLQKGLTGYPFELGHPVYSQCEQHYNVNIIIIECTASSNSSRSIHLVAVKKRHNNLWIKRVSGYNLQAVYFVICYGEHSVHPQKLNRRIKIQFIGQTLICQEKSVIFLDFMCVFCSSTLYYYFILNVRKLCILNVFSCCNKNSYSSLHFLNSILIDLNDLLIVVRIKVNDMKAIIVFMGFCSLYGKASSVKFRKWANSFDWTLITCIWIQNCCF